MKINNVGISIGNLTELKFQTLCFENNIECLLPNVEGTPYDFVIRGYDGLKFQTVQVKTSYKDKQTNRERVDIRKGDKKRPYAIGDFDYLVVYRPISKEWYFIPYQNISNIKAEIGIQSPKWKGFKFNGTVRKSRTRTINSRNARVTKKASKKSVRNARKRL